MQLKQESNKILEDKSSLSTKKQQKICAPAADGGETVRVWRTDPTRSPRLKVRASARASSPAVTEARGWRQPTAPHTWAAETRSCRTPSEPEVASFSRSSCTARRRTLQLISHAFTGTLFIIAQRSPSAHTFLRPSQWPTQRARKPRPLIWEMDVVWLIFHNVIHGNFSHSSSNIST